jgi:hypothetical protein
MKEVEERIGRRAMQDGKPRPTNVKDYGIATNTKIE